MKLPHALLWALAVLGATPALFCSPAARPNLLVIVADDVSPAYLSCYGGRTPTPHLDRLAASGVRFDRAYSVSPLCNPSRYTLFTGRFASRNPALTADVPADAPYSITQNTRLTEADVTLARTLGAAGYFTGHIGKWHSNFLYGPIPDFPEGGDVNDPKIDAILRERTRLQSAAMQKISGFDFVGAFVSGNLDTLGPKLPLASHHNAEWQTQATLEFLDTAAKSGRPFYLHVANTIPHSPDNLAAIDADPRYSRGGILDPVPRDHPSRDSIRARLKSAGIAATGTVGSINAGMIWLDDQVGAVLRRLDELGLRDNTLVIFLGDHSVVGKGSPYAQGNLVPLLASWPAGFGHRDPVPFPVSLLDVAPTLLAAAGATTPAHPVDGADLLPALRGPAPVALADRPVFIEIGTTRSVIRGDWQYIAHRLSPATLARLRTQPDAPVPDIYDYLQQPFINVNLPHKPDYFAPDQLYDLAADPFCKTNLVAEPAHAVRLTSLRADLARFLATLPRPFPLATPPEMLSDAYRAHAHAQQQAAATKSAARYPYDVERAFNLNLPSPDDSAPTDPAQRVGKLPGQARE